MQKMFMVLVALTSTALLPTSGNAKGCVKGAAVGAVAGHVAGHHAVVGAAAGCVIQHHREKVRDKAAAQKATQQNNAPPAAGQTQAPGQ